MNIFKRLIGRFQDIAYRRSYAESFVDSYLATQIKVLREQRGLSQQQFAELAGVRQSQICRWEHVDNSSWQVRSLKNLAKALDVVLVVKFASFGELVPEIEAFGRKALERPSFDDDPVFASTVAIAETEISVDAFVGGDARDLGMPIPIATFRGTNENNTFNTELYEWAA